MKRKKKMVKASMHMEETTMQGTWREKQNSGSRWIKDGDQPKVG